MPMTASVALKASNPIPFGFARHTAIEVV